MSLSLSLVRSPQVPINDRIQWYERALQLLGEDRSNPDLQMEIADKLGDAKVQQHIAEAVRGRGNAAEANLIGNGRLLEYQELYHKCVQHSLFESLIHLFDTVPMTPAVQQQLQVAWISLCRQTLAVSAQQQLPQPHALPRLMATFTKLRSLAVKPNMCPLNALVAELEQYRAMGHIADHRYAANLIFVALGVPANDAIRAVAAYARSPSAAAPPPSIECLLCALEQYARQRPHLASADALGLAQLVAQRPEAAAPAVRARIEAVMAELA